MEFDLSFRADLKRVLLERTLPFRRDLGSIDHPDGLALVGGICFSDFDRQVGDAAHGFWVDDRTGGEAPGAFEQNTDAETKILSAGHILNLLFAGGNGFVAIAIDSNVRVSDPEVFSTC